MERINRNRSIFLQAVVYLVLAGLTLYNIVSGQAPVVPLSDPVPVMNRKVISTHERIAIKGGSFVETRTTETILTHVKE